MGPFRLFILGLLLACGAGMAWTGGASAQPGQTGGAAAPDTARGRPVFGFLVPTYSSTYSLIRGESAWLQKFNFSNDWQRFGLKNDTQYTIKTDPKRVNFKVRQGSSNNDLRYMLLDGLPLAAQLNYSRSGQRDGDRESGTDQLDTNIGTDYYFRTGRLRNDVHAFIGLTNRTDTQLQQGDRLTTNDLGLSRKINGSSLLIGLVDGLTIKLDGNLQVEGSNAKFTEGTGILQGTVSPRVVSGDPPKAWVEVTRANSLDVVAADSTGTTSGDGTGRRFTFGDLQPGDYEVRISAPGYETVTRLANIQVERTTDLGDTPLTRGYHSSFAQINLSGDLSAPGTEYFPAVHVAMTNVYGGVWQVEVRNVSSGDHRFKFTTGDARGDYGSDIAGCGSDRVLGPVVLAPAGQDNAICASFTGGGGFRITLDEEALRFRVERLRVDEDGPKNNLNSGATLALTYAPGGSLSTDLTLTQNHRSERYIFLGSDPAKKGRREQDTVNLSGLVYNLDWHPASLKTTGVTLKATRNYNSTEKVVDVDRAAEHTSSTVEARLRHRLLGNQFNLHFEQDNDKDLPRSRTSSRTLTRVVDGALDRQVGRRITARGAGELRLRRQTYADQLQDQDGLRSKLEVGMTYRPDSTVTGTVVASRTMDDSRNINSTLSKNSRLEERYTVAFGVDWALTPRTTLSQRYNYQPAFTTFQFNSSADNLLRNRDVTTTLNTVLNPRLTLSMKHYYQLQESGGYRRAADGTRLFAVGDNLYVQDFTTSLAWKPLTWINFRTDERLYRRDQVRVARNIRVVSSRIEFTQFAQMQRSLPGGGTLQVDFSYFIQSSLKPTAGQQEHYVTANITLNKTF